MDDLVRDPGRTARFPRRHPFGGLKKFIDLEVRDDDVEYELLRVGSKGSNMFLTSGRGMVSRLVTGAAGNRWSEIASSLSLQASLVEPSSNFFMTSL